jgi:hypothetical protein
MPTGLWLVLLRTVYAQQDGPVSKSTSVPPSGSRSTMRMTLVAAFFLASAVLAAFLYASVLIASQS